MIRSIISRKFVSQSFKSYNNNNNIPNNTISRYFNNCSKLLADANTSSSTGSSSGGPVLNLRFVTPNDTIVNNKPVYMVTVPAITGVMGILADHAPTIAQLKPGLVTVHNNDINDVSMKYFVSGGFAVMKSDNTASVTAVEAIKLDDLDIQQARKGLDDSNNALNKASSEKEKAEAQIAVEVYEAIVQALEAK